MTIRPSGYWPLRCLGAVLVAWSLGSSAQMPREEPGGRPDGRDPLGVLIGNVPELPARAALTCGTMTLEVLVDPPELLPGETATITVTAFSPTAVAAGVEITVAARSGELSIQQGRTGDDGAFRFSWSARPEDAFSAGGEDLVQRAAIEVEALGDAETPCSTPVHVAVLPGAGNP